MNNKPNSEKKMEKEIFYSLSDNADLAGLVLANLDAVKEYILNDVGDVHPSEVKELEYTIRPVLMTQDEFDNLKEYEF